MTVWTGPSLPGQSETTLASSYSIRYVHGTYLNNSIHQRCHSQASQKSVHLEPERVLSRSKSDPSLIRTTDQRQKTNAVCDSTLRGGKKGEKKVTNWDLEAEIDALQSLRC